MPSTRLGTASALMLGVIALLLTFPSDSDARGGHGGGGHGGHGGRSGGVARSYHAPAARVFSGGRVYHAGPRVYHRHVRPVYVYNNSCGWLRQRALATGSRYWWRRYRECLGYY